jgi:G6PDH family F420-dependent oxidoreductase
VRIHPAIIAQAAATAAVQLDGKFVLGMGSGEALDEHILGDPWPSVGVRQDMMEEAVEVIRLLHEGRMISHHGAYYEVQEARIYTLPDQPVPIYVSAFGPQAAELAGRIGDGMCTTMPDAELIKTFRDSGGGSKSVQTGTKVNWGSDAAAALTEAHRVWGNEALPGQLAQTLPRPQDFQDAMSLVPEGLIAEAMTCGPDVDQHVTQLREFVDAGADEVYVQQIGPDFDGFFTAYEKDVLPTLR